MTVLSRVRVALSGFPGGPGVSTFYFLDTATAVDSLHTFYSSIKAVMPPNVHIQVANSGDTFDDATGTLTGSWTSAAVSDIACTGSPAYSGPVGAVVRWDTGTVLDGRRLRGHTFMVPLTTDGYDATGRIAAGCAAILSPNAAAFQLAQNASLVIWHRPFAGRAATSTKPAKPAHAGGHGLVLASSIPLRAAVLRSRRG